MHFVLLLIHDLNNMKQNYWSVAVNDSTDAFDRSNTSREIAQKKSMDTLSRVTAVWFWSTLLGTFYIGVIHVLPDLYGNQTTLLAVQQTISIIMFCEIFVNWLCVRYVTSYYRPEDQPFSKEVSSLRTDSKSFVIDLAQLRPAEPNRGSAEKGTSSSVYSLPLTSLKNIDESFPLNRTSGNRKWRREDSIFVVATTSSPDDWQTSVDKGSGRRLETRRLVYPYWSWKPCSICRHRRPPRAYHCRYCGECVLKRDHHCLLVGRCIGLNNQRHFIVFVTWSTIALAYSLVHGLMYAFSVFLTRNSFWDFLLPIAVVRTLSRSVRLIDLAMVGAFYSLGWFLFTSTRFALEQWYVVFRGVTTFEDEHQIKVRQLLLLTLNLDSSTFD